MTDSALRKTPLHALHLELGGKMVPFAGYEMPVQYLAGVLKEHLHTREKAGLFDVSHMGQAFVAGHEPALEVHRQDDHQETERQRQQDGPNQPQRGSRFHRR